MRRNHFSFLISFLHTCTSLSSFSPITTRKCTFFPSQSTQLYSTSAERAPTEITVESETSIVKPVIEPKEAVKIFGRLAEKYIILDPTAGMCCYSACTDCEYRLPGGGYIMADQSASRPKWIPNYEKRSYNENNHVTGWSTGVFTDGPAVTKSEFIENIKQMKFAPPLGGPYVGASAGAIEDDTALAFLFDSLIVEGKEKLTKHRMSIRMKELANNEEGLSWPNFSGILL